MSSMKMKNLQVQDRPREKLIMMGPEYLTDSELLAIILRTGGKSKSATDLAKELIHKFSILKNLLLADFWDIKDLPGMGDSKAASIKAMMEICKRINNPTDETHTTIDEPKDVFNFIKKDLIHKDKEYLYLLSLSSRGKLLKKSLITIGTLNETLIHPREIYKQALINKACEIILVHNHPSQDPKPSLEDIQVTQRIFHAGLILGIPLLDHVIVTDDTFFSIKQNNLLGDINFDPKEGEKNKD